MKIIIGADIVPTKSNQIFFEHQDCDKLVDYKLKEILNKADYVALNLEVPLSDRETPIKKCGPNLIASTRTAEAIKKLGVDFVTLANNHIFDQGRQGLEITISTLDRVGIAYAGAGISKADIEKDHIITIDEKKIGFFCCAEHEFSIFDDKEQGANPFEDMESPDHIYELKKYCDYVIVLYHGGKEHYRLPSPQLQKACRKMVDKGADLVVCQHTHCIGAKETWNKGTIVYGQGNFLFDNSNNELWKTSILIEIDDLNEIKFIPIVKDGISVRVANNQEKEEILNAFIDRSNMTDNLNIIREQYDAHAKAQLCDYAQSFLAMDNIPYRILFKIFGSKFKQRVIYSKLTQKRVLEWTNFIECEAHRELILAALKNIY